jgi:signal transduction histidine kinase
LASIILSGYDSYRLSRSKVAHLPGWIDGGARQGSGLGLAFCRLAAQAQGGRIWLESRAPAGTTVTFTLASAGARSAYPPPA